MVSQPLKEIFEEFIVEVGVKPAPNYLDWLCQQFDRFNSPNLEPNPVNERFASSHETYLEYYRETVVPHKVAVFKAGMKLKNKGLLGFMTNADEAWKQILLMHDLSKFSVEEAAYATHDFSDAMQNTPQQLQAFERAWHHHKIHNPHHPEHWWDVSKDGTTDAMVMPKRYVVEMVADWIGAGETYDQSFEEYLVMNLAKFYFHPGTARYLEGMLDQLMPRFKIEVKDQYQHWSWLVLTEK